MTVFLIILAVLAIIIIAICSLSATVTLVYDKGWSTKLGVLFIERDVELSKILSFILFPQKKAEEVKESRRAEKEADKEAEKPAEVEAEKLEPEQKSPENAPKKANPIKKLWDEQGIVGILSLISNLIDTANSAVLTLIRGLHIYSLYVMILVGGGDADFIAQSYGALCKYYYPLKGWILSDLKVDNYDDYIQPDFIADRTEVEFQLIASINVGLLLKVLFKAGFIFVKNLIKDKKGD